MVPLAMRTFAVTPGDSLGPGDYTHTLSVGGLKRTSLVHVPKSYDGTKLVPVVLAYHGGNSNAEQMVGFCGLNDKADQAGFLVVYPNGTGRRATAPCR